MFIKLLKCQMCGNEFEAEVLDEEDQNKHDRQVIPIRCPKCTSTRIEPVRTLRRTR